MMRFWVLLAQVILSIAESVDVLEGNQISAGEEELLQHLDGSGWSNRSRKKNKLMGLAFAIGGFGLFFFIIWFIGDIIGW